MIIHNGVCGAGENLTYEVKGSWFHSLRVKLLFVLVPVMVVSVVLGMAVLGRSLQEFFRKNTERQTEKLGQAILAALRPTMLQDSADGLAHALAGLEKNPEVRRVWIIDKNGRVGHAADNSVIGRTLDKSRDPICTVCHRNGSLPKSQTYFTIDESGTHVLRHISPIPNEKVCWGCHDRGNRLIGILLLEESTQPFEDIVKTVQYSLGVTGAITLAVLVALTLIAATLIVERPVRSLRAGVRQIGEGNLAVRIPVRGRDELADLAGRFNGMAEDLGRNIDELRIKNSELSMVYSIVEHLTKTINLGELKEIILQTLIDVFSADEVMLLSRLARPESGEILVKTREKKRLGRIHHDGEGGEKPEGIPPDLYDAWLDGELRDSSVTPDGRIVVIAVPIRDRRPVVLLIRRNLPFEAREVNPKLLGALADHIRVAVENARLFTLAITDELTQLFTVRHFRVRMEDAAYERQQNGRSFSLLMLDLDYFKTVNDRFGHPAGDAVLKRVARVLADSIRTVDSAYRYGGEEFAVLLPDTNPATAASVADRIRQDIETLETEVSGGVKIGVTVSIGVANCPANGESYDDLVAAADAALYAAKRFGRNRVAESPPRE